jgi:hypothetical protein
MGGDVKVKGELRDMAGESRGGRGDCGEAVHGSNRIKVYYMHACHNEIS